jgi:hypothetical protein
MGLQETKGGGMAQNDLLEAALLYASKGWKVFPCHTIRNGRCGCSSADCTSPGKHPMVQGGVYAGTDDRDKIVTWWTRWPEANVGVATGMASGFVVLDVDADKGGYESLAEMIKDNGPLPDHLAASNTGGGGKHILFKHPGVQVGNKTKIAPGLDIRGDGGYIIAPPSLHLSGKRYEWVVLRTEANA